MVPEMEQPMVQQQAEPLEITGNQAVVGNGGNSNFRLARNRSFAVES